MKEYRIENEIHGEERAFYHLTDASVSRCTFAGEEDGESALKECRDIDVSDCLFRLRYPLWHTKRFTLSSSEMTETCRAALWYAEDGKIASCTLGGIKCLRECDDMTLSDCKITSPEFAWKCRTLSMTGCDVTGEYFLLDARDVTLKNVTLHGKYSFQYVENATVSHCVLDTKDAFWHSKNVRVEDCEVLGEYLGWYSEGLTLVRCHIRGTQPLCYCKNLTLIDCTMDETDLSFEYSDVEADVRGTILSVKNPASGHITADAFGSIILEDSIVENNCRVVTRGK